MSHVECTPKRLLFKASYVPVVGLERAERVYTLKKVYLLKLKYNDLRRKVKWQQQKKRFPSGTTRTLKKI